MLHARHHFLADVAALGEVDAIDEVQVGVVREGVAIGEIEPAFGHAKRDAAGVVGGAAGLVLGGGFLARDDAAGAEPGGAGIGGLALRGDDDGKLRR